MRFFQIVVTVLFAALMSSCGRSSKVSWKDGDYKVYATDLDYTATVLGRDHDPGMLVLVDEVVVAVGSNVSLIVAQRLNVAHGTKEFYIVKKLEDKIEGPFSEGEFLAEKKSRSLPDFSWRK